MPGAVELDADTIKPPSNIAYQDDAGNWHAGPDYKGASEGSFVDPSSAKMRRSLRQNANMVKQIMRSNDVDETEARETSHTIREELRDAEGEEERREIWKQYVNS